MKAGRDHIPIRTAAGTARDHRRIVVVLSAILGRTPTAEEYRAAVEGIDLTRFAPPLEKPAVSHSVHF
ncbi:hypothetical protein [Paenirhodobacter sp.]|uniref:hypothetical protein n=1 Tax=Paenirhodobacter sp. TaxID=1965326 RepID=UPI003B3C3165